MCRVCLQNPCHQQCPNYIPPKCKYRCSICSDGILEGEEYIRNNDFEYAHLECFLRMKDLAEWLGYDVRVMEDCWK